MWIELVVIAASVCSALTVRVPDWLVTKIDTPTQLTNTSRGTLLLSNGLIQREFHMVPDFGTVDFYSIREQSSALRAINPEATIALGEMFSFLNLGIIRILHQ